MVDLRSTPPETSVLIRTFNEERHLPGLLEGIGRQEYRDFEIVVVDSGSVDRTREIAARHTSKLMRINSHDFTYGYSLNVGCEAATGRFVVIVSAHMLTMDDQWLGAMVAPMREGGVAMTYGRQVGLELSNFGETQDLRRTFGGQRLVLKPPNFFANNANSAVVRELWQQHPFDEALPGLEDIEWAKHWMERGYTVVYEPTAALQHIHEETWPQIRRRYFREAVAARHIGITGRGQIIPEVFAQGRHLVGDLIAASRQKLLREKVGEISLFRFNKVVGTVTGILDGTVLADPEAREALFFDKTYKAVVVSAPGRVSLEDREMGKIAPGDVLIRVAYQRVSDADMAVYNGGGGHPGASAPTYPVTPGRDFSGWVVKTGVNVDHLHEGDPVVAESLVSCGRCPQCARGNRSACPSREEVGFNGRDGGCAEYVVLPGLIVHKLPEGIDMKAACLTQPLATLINGLTVLTRGRTPMPETRYAVIGDGVLGLLAFRVLSQRGHRVEKIKPDVSAGDPGSAQYTELPADVVLVTAATQDVLEHTLLNSRRGATILLFGPPYGESNLTLNGLLPGDKTIIVSVETGPEQIEEAIRMLNTLELREFGASVFPLAQYLAAWDAQQQRQSGGTLLRVTESP